MSQDKLAQRLDSLLSSVDSTLETPVDVDVDVDVDAPPPFAGGVPLAQILDLPLAETPEAFRLPPPSQEEADALARIQSSLFTGFNLADLAALSGSDPLLRAPEAPSVMASDAPISSSGSEDKPGPFLNHADHAIEHVYSTGGYVPYINQVESGRNSVPSGIYSFKPDALFYAVSGSKTSGCTCSSSGISAHDLGVSGTQLQTSINSLTQPVVYVVAALNALSPMHGDTPSDPWFLCLVANKPVSGLYCIKLSDVLMYHPCCDAALQTVFKCRNNNIYWFCSQLSLLQTTPIPALIDKAYISYTIEDMLESAVLKLLPSTMSRDCLTAINDALSLYRSLGQQQKNSLVVLDKLLSKISKE